jgi:hypothetical protein
MIKLESLVTIKIKKHKLLNVTSVQAKYYFMFTIPTKF